MTVKSRITATTKAPKKRQRTAAAGPVDDPVAGERTVVTGLTNSVVAANGRGKTRQAVATPPGGMPPKRIKGGKPVKKQKRRGAAAKLVPVLAATGHEDRLIRLAMSVQAVRTGKQISPRTTKLLAGGIPKMAQKLVEEAAETAIDAVRANRIGFVNESADLLYNLVVLWSAMNVTADEVWAEMDRREALLGLAEKLPKPDDSGG